MKRVTGILAAAVFGLAVGSSAFADSTIDNVGNGQRNETDINGNGKKDTMVVKNVGNGRRNDVEIAPDRGDTVIVRGTGNGSRNTIHIKEDAGGTVVVDASALGKGNKVVIDRAPGETVKVINTANGKDNNVVIRDVDANGNPIKKSDKGGNGKSGSDKGGSDMKHAPDAKPDDTAHHVTLKDRQALRASPDGKVVKPAVQPAGGQPIKISDPRVTMPKVPADQKVKNPTVLAKDSADVKPGTTPKPIQTLAKLPESRASATPARPAPTKPTTVASTAGRAHKK